MRQYYENMQTLCAVIYVIYTVSTLFGCSAGVSTQKHYTRTRKLELREDVRRMFQHAYDGYLNHASSYDELRPLTCDGHDTWGSYSLTLIDALDTLATMGNFSEFRRVSALLTSKMNFNRDINVSVFETNIRIVGGLLSAHLMARRAGMDLEPGWPCQGPLLRMAEDVARRLLPAFDTNTGMPFGTVNLRYGVPKGETTVTCTAGVGTFLIEFGTLSRLTGNTIYEEVALQAIYALWERRSSIGLFGNHIDVQTGRWTALDSGIGAGVDSLFEYLAKGAVLLNRPELLQMFHQAREPIDKYMRKDDWYVWVGMNKGHVTLPVFQSLESFWPGILSLVGDTEPAMRTMARYIGVWKKYGFLPEFYNIPAGEAAINREVYPLRPELIESAMYLYRATGNQMLLELGEHMLETIEFSAKTKCGYATIRNVVTHEKENRMESFFLAETTKYLYLLFDEDNFLHNSGDHGDLLQMEDGGVCVIEAGAYIFNTEAHPMDMSALHCCHDHKDDIYAGLDLQRFTSKALQRRAQEQRVAEQDAWIARCQPTASRAASIELTAKGSQTAVDDGGQEPTMSVDIEVYDEQQKPAGDILVSNFEQMRMQEDNELNRSLQDIEMPRNQVTVSDLDEFFSQRRENFATTEDTLNYVLEFLSNFTMDVAFIRGLQLFDVNITNVLGAGAQKEYESRMRSLWQLYELEQQYAANIKLIQRLSLLEVHPNSDAMHRHLAMVLDNLDNYYYQKISSHPIDIELVVSDNRDDDDVLIISQAINEARIEYEIAMMNATAMQEFVQRVYLMGTSDTAAAAAGAATTVLRLQPLIDPDELATMEVIKLEPSELRDLFKYTRRVVDFRKRMSETVDRLQNLMQDLKSTSSGNVGVAAAAAEQQIESSHLTMDNGQSEEQQQQQQHAEEENAKMSKQTRSLTELKGAVGGGGGGGGGGGTGVKEANNDDESSVWAQFVETILRKATLQGGKKFNEALLLEKTRKSLERYAKRPMPYQLFTCRRPAYIEHFAYRDHYPESL